VADRRFESTAGRLRVGAYRIPRLGELADDAVQDAWLRVSRADAGAVGDLWAWLTTVVGPSSASHAAQPGTPPGGALDSTCPTATSATNRGDRH